jgi:hypothetical protein
MATIKEDLSFYVGKLARGEKFSLARYGDGELYCMWGKKGENSNGCRYSPELRMALIDSMKHWNDPSFIYGLQRVLPQDQERAEREYPEIKWYDSEIFSEAVANGELFPVIEQLRNMRVIFIGNESIYPIINKLFPNSHFIQVEKSNAFEDRDFVMDKLKHGESGWVHAFSCGMAANAFVSELHGDGNWNIDLGHIWDPFTGNMSRCDLEGKTMVDIEKNLCEK